MGANKLLRKSQLIVPFGVGAIVNMPDESIMACSIDNWADEAQEKIFDERLQQRLKVAHFCSPAPHEKFFKGLPFVRFPRWLFCPKCRKLKSIEEWTSLWTNVKRRDFDVPRCVNDGIKLVPSRFIVSCCNGHIDDFPWVRWAHKNSKGAHCSHPQLEISTAGGGAGLSRIRVKCTACEEPGQTMQGAFGPDVFKKLGWGCSGNRPWDGTKEDCKLFAMTLQRGASNVYFPKIVSSIVIPPYSKFSDDLSSAIKRTGVWSVLSTGKNLCTPEMEEKLILSLAEEVSKRLCRPVIEVVEKAKQMLGMLNPAIETQTETEYRYDEYRAFSGGIPFIQAESRDFNIESLSGVDYGIKGIDQVVLVHRLKEIRALTAFSRISPLDREVSGLPDDVDQNAPVRPVSVRTNPHINWFPGIEVRGEGIFLSFDKDYLQSWAEQKSVQKRSHIINDRYATVCKERNRNSRTITPEFIALHTFAHILVRQLSFECGYASAALRERIYCSQGDRSRMAGLLIYTASADSDGTLGGLVRQGRKDRFSGIIEKAIRSVEWCSSDPVCRESAGQGTDSLNLAACYACTLLPETSCEENNKFLDRVLVVGLPDDPDLGLFTGMLK